MSSKEKQVRVCVVGMGIGRPNGAALSRNTRGKVVAICDLDEERMKSFAKDLPGKVKLYTDYKKMCQASDIDAVFVGTPNQWHVPIALEAVKNGKHVMVTKPLADCEEAAEKLVSEAEAAGLVNMMSLSTRFGHSCQHLGDLARDNYFGELYYARARSVRRSGIPAWNLGFIQKGGGAFRDMGVHVLDSAWWIIGMPKPVAVLGAAGAKFGPRGLGYWNRTKPPKETYEKYASDDYAGGFITFENGIGLQVESFWASHQPGEFQIELFGTEAGATLSPLKAYRTDKKGEFEDIDITLPKSKYNEAWDAIADHFIECILYQINGIRIVLFFLICYTKHMKNTKHGVSPHFSIEALKQRYMECECPRERMRWHAIWLLADTENPRKPREVAAIVGCTTDCVRKLRRRYNADGEEALRDKRKTNGGRPFLDAPQQASLEKALSAPPIDGGLWTGPKVAAWISGTLKRPVSAVTGWKYLRRLGWTLQRPRPQHQASATPEAQQTFKKKLEARVAALKSEHPEKPVEVWAEDETRLGLLPVHRRVWAKKGVRPTAPVCPAYKWLYGFGFVRPQTGETYWLLMPTVSIEVMNLALAEFARDVNPEAKKQIVLLVDRAGFHTSKAVQVPAGIELFYLPPYSPELQPAERLWPLLREVIANRVLKTLSSLEKVLVNRCQWFSKNWDIVQPHVGFQWICEIEKQYESS